MVAKRIRNKYINDKIRNQRRTYDNEADNAVFKKKGVEVYWDFDSQQHRVRLDGYGANGPTEILVNMIAVDMSIKVYFPNGCMTCGKNLPNRAKFKHFSNGACKKKARVLQSGGVVFCSYCEITGAHWVEACPLLVSFCYCCWVWGHNFLHHRVADKGYLERLMRKFNEMRNWHHINSDKSRKGAKIPMNELLPLGDDNVAIRYEGSQETIDEIADCLIGNKSDKAAWLSKENWINIERTLSDPSYEWVTNSEGFCLKPLHKSADQALATSNHLLHIDRLEEDQLDYEYEYEDQDNEEYQSDELGSSEEDNILLWLDY